MRDSTEPIDTSKSDAPPQLELGQHLMRRHTEPLGVIDVRHPQQHYARTAGWIAQRFALLEHWKTRYGSDERSVDSKRRHGVCCAVADGSARDCRAEPRSAGARRHRVGRVTAECPLHSRILIIALAISRQAPRRATACTVAEAGLACLRVRLHHTSRGQHGHIRQL